MSNQFADVSFVVSLGSSRNAPSHKERREVCSALYHCKKRIRRLMALYNWIFQTEKFVGWKIYINNKTQIYKIQAKYSYLKIKIKSKSKD